jgi:hypothetical protein
MRIGIDLTGVINAVNDPGSAYNNPVVTPESNINVPMEGLWLGEGVTNLIFADKLGKSTKYIPDKKTIKIIGATDVVFNEVSYKASDGSSMAVNGLTETLDTTTNPDRAVLKLYNGRGFNVYLRSASLDGKLIYQYSGEAGELIHDSLKRDDDIRRNGETVFEIGNEYIVDATQCAKIADFWYKFLGKKKHLYSLSIPGCAPWYNVGDWYNLSVGRADTNEYIDAVVECYAVDCERTAGGIGSTTLLLRDVEDNWSKTTLYATRLATGGSPKRRVNRSNIVTVASSTYDGTYDYKCDGTDDNVQIQAAIDYVSNTWGGGTVLLTNGAYTLGATLVMKSAIILKGVGNNTILKPHDSSVTTMIDFGTAIGSKIADFVIDGNSTTVTMTTALMDIVDGKSLGTATGITIQNYLFDNIGTETYARGFNQLIDISSCNVTACVISNTNNTSVNSRLQGIIECKNVVSCLVYGNEGTAYGVLRAFYNCENVNSSSAYSNTFAGTYSNMSGFFLCKNIVSCMAYSNSTTGANGVLRLFESCENISSCKSSLNTTTNVTTGTIQSFLNCINMSVCSTEDNDAIGGSPQYGFYSCRSVQQCKSVGDTTPYGTGASQSYADSGTANACADTAAGGYNS